MFIGVQLTDSASKILPLTTGHQVIIFLLAEHMSKVHNKSGNKMGDILRINVNSNTASVKIILGLVQGIQSC